MSVTGGAAAHGGRGKKSGGGGDGCSRTVRHRVVPGGRGREEARVLHTGNGWVRLQLSDGAQTNLRSWDLEGYDPPPASASPTSKKAASTQPALLEIACE